ncbi:hypothetical protein [Fusobacterium pseudoperiodonticum]|uniref:Uncharacterized protein n=1 Tax=Fusobacterium pseudoperiodonticum TaxID=2663009 RepID=A0A2D3NSL7_9FUSO|nr:hypothetical protein [Fusobacterium pseudoperiodonticum]ATV58395.1 hypothetical protein CTM72_00755 [Fusobacterium pseudoperiodonticum]ATV70659.1 hypothetical protein CTM98_08350 [Fusobacterium pseudoperiodonticum]
MNEPKKWGYIYDEKLNMYVPNLPRQKKFAKVLLILSIISFVAVLIQIYFFDKSSYEKISFLAYTTVMVFLFLALYLVLKINIRIVEKRLEEVKGLKLSNDLEIKALKNKRFFAFIIICILSIVVFVSNPDMIKKFSIKYIFYLILAIVVLVYNSYKLFEEFKNNKYSLIITGKTIKIYYENNEKEFITTDNISYVKFYAISRPRGRKDKNPTLQIFDSEEKILVEMTIKPIDYYSLKKYFEKYNVRIDNQYREF